MSKRQHVAVMIAIGTLLTATLNALPSARIQNDTMIPQDESTSRSIKPLSTEEIQHALVDLPSWSVRDNRLSKTYDCGSFSGAVSFIVAFSYKCEAIDHHPEIFNVYSKVKVEMTTYDVGKKISHLDFQLAQHIEKTAEKLGLISNV